MVCCNTLRTRGINRDPISISSTPADECGKVSARFASCKKISADANSRLQFPHYSPGRWNMNGRRRSTTLLVAGFFMLVISMECSAQQAHSFEQLQVLVKP